MRWQNHQGNLNINAILQLYFFNEGRAYLKNPKSNHQRPLSASLFTPVIVRYVLHQSQWYPYSFIHCAFELHEVLWIFPKCIYQSEKIFKYMHNIFFLSAQILNNNEAIKALYIHWTRSQCMAWDVSPKYSPLDHVSYYAYFLSIYIVNHA